MTIQGRILCFKISDLNLQAFAYCGANRVATSKIVPSGADLATSQCHQSFVKPEFMEPQNLSDGQHPDSMIKDFGALICNMQDAMHRAAIYTGTQEDIQYKS